METKYNCNHHITNTLILCDVCNHYYPCKICHDKFEPCEININDITSIMCTLCGTTQPKSDKCIKCRNVFANYYCNLCCVWSDKTEIFHCKKCNKCKYGKEENFLHCPKCETCISKEVGPSHTHVSGGVKNYCPICAEMMFGSPRQAILLQCGHVLHEDCYYRNVTSSIHCPICFKLVGDDSDIREMIKVMVEENMGEKIKSKEGKCEISCFECGNYEISEMYEMFNECRYCGSFNTKLK